MTLRPTMCVCVRVYVYVYVYVYVFKCMWLCVDFPFKISCHPVSSFHPLVKGWPLT